MKNILKIDLYFELDSNVYEYIFNNVNFTKINLQN